MNLNAYRILFLLLIVQVVSFGQKIVSHSNQQWIQYYNQTKISDRWSFGIDGGFRWIDGKKLQYIGRTGFGFQLNPKLKIGAGIATTDTYKSSILSRTEFRTYQELFGMFFEKKISYTQRLRIEERFLTTKSTNVLPDRHEFNWRFRYQFTLSVLLFELSHTHPQRNISLGISDEIFINAGQDVVYNLLDRNRLLIGPSIQLSKSLSFAGLYMHQFSQKNSPAAYDEDNVVWVTIKHLVEVKRSKKDSE